MRIDYSLFVPKYYQMDPKLEDLLFDGTELREGMIVLPESPEFRVDVDREPLEGEVLETAMRYNRWAMVTRLNITGNSLVFIAEYADGSKKKISVSITHAWLMMLPNAVEESVDPAVQELKERAVGTAQVTEPRAWATSNTPPFGGGDGDLEPMPKRQPGGKLLFDDMVAARNESVNHDPMSEPQI